MKAGKLRHRIIIERPVEVEDEGGGRVRSWLAAESYVGTFWGSIDGRTGRERYHAQQIESVYSHLITMRYRPGIEPEMRARHGAHVYNIRAALDPDGTRRELLLFVEEEGPDGTNAS